MSAPVFLGVDLGTTRTKVGLITPSGDAPGLGRAANAIDVDPRRGHAVQDVDAWWAGLRNAIAEAIAVATTETGASPRIDAISVAGHGPTFVAVDARGHAVYPAVTWLDSRSTAERDEDRKSTRLNSSH